jgi:hypothetical protein
MLAKCRNKQHVHGISG